eukprot:2934164-Prymnesium_polylepis.1
MPAPAATSALAGLAAAGVDVPAAAPEPCAHCGRMFAADRIAKHVSVCQGASEKRPRRVFDSRNSRLGELSAELRADGSCKSGPHAEASAPPPPAEPAATGKDGGGAPQAKAKWRSQSEALRQVTEYNKTVEAAKRAGVAPPPPPVTAPENDGRQQCPHCSRRFGAAAFERHEP